MFFQVFFIKKLLSILRAVTPSLRLALRSASEEHLDDAETVLAAVPGTFTKSRTVNLSALSLPTLSS